VDVSSFGHGVENGSAEDPIEVVGRRRRQFARELVEHSFGPGAARVVELEFVADRLGGLQHSRSDVQNRASHKDPQVEMGIPLR
jgi:hypothetical protein